MADPAVRRSPARTDPVLDRGGPPGDGRDTVVARGRPAGGEPASAYGPAREGLRRHLSRGPGRARLRAIFAVARSRGCEPCSTDSERSSRTPFPPLTSHLSESTLPHREEERMAAAQLPSR